MLRGQPRSSSIPCSSTFVVHILFLMHVGNCAPKQNRGALPTRYSKRGDEQSPDNPGTRVQGQFEASYDVAVEPLVRVLVEDLPNTQNKSTPHRDASGDAAVWNKRHVKI